jgi:hypothetical protein
MLSAGDRDVYKIQVGSGTVSIQVNSVSHFGGMPRTGLDAHVALARADGSTIIYRNLNARSAAATRVEGSVDLEAGTYYIWLWPAEFLDPRTNGYSDYGSIGQYALKATFPSAQTGKWSALSKACSGPCNSPGGSLSSLRFDVASANLM